MTGRVQGVGFRPFVWNRAAELGLTGWVQNESSGVTIEIQGLPGRVSEFLKGFDAATPPLAKLDSLETIEVPPETETRFLIRRSVNDDRESTPVSPDISICDDCLAEMRDPRDRRFAYPFINCTNCGPRFTIVKDLPYDRAATTMETFVMCRQCQTEYDDPANRRFHAQPNACAKCGPTLWAVVAETATDSDAIAPPGGGDCNEVIDAFAAAIRAGQIVAVKGIGGFHLACDATNVNAIESLRRRKGRVDKPFAVMVADVEQAESFAMLSATDRRIIQSKERPIVLLQKKTNAAAKPMLDALAPGNHFVGVMLPYSPLHYLLTDRHSPLLLTSGNLVDEPIARDNGEAIRRLSSIADWFLLHDREIHSVCDDSVVRHFGGAVLPIRRSRGYAPMPVRFRQPGRDVLAVGGEIKSTFCLTHHRYAYTSQHIGDVENLETLETLRSNVDQLTKLFRVEIEAVAADLHPDYLSTQFARELAAAKGVPLIGVQHHFAHAAALRAEHGLESEDPILGCCFDGTGYGTDGAIWGGEFLLAGQASFERLAHLEYFSLPGGDASVRRPYRTAIALLKACGVQQHDRLPPAIACTHEERSVLEQQLDRNLNCAHTSSMGRLFDGVASIIGIRHLASYEAQAAIEMESMAAEVIDQENVQSADQYNFGLEFTDQGTFTIGYRNLIASIADDVLKGTDPRLISARFHHAVARMIVDVCERVREKTGVKTVGLTGGVFQNVVLLKLARARLTERGFDVLTHSIVPPNDGGIALGQAMVARKRLDLADA